MRPSKEQAAEPPEGGTYGSHAASRASVHRPTKTYKPASGAGNSYMAKFTDHHTPLKSVNFLCKKNEAIDALINYTQDVVIPSGHRLQRRTVEVYTGLGYREYCLQTGLEQECAATNTPYQNGISEREWASLWNMTRCFLAEAGVPKYLWQEAFCMAVYLANRVPSTLPGGKRLSRCGMVKHPRDLSTFELLVPERSCLKSDTPRS